MLFKRLKPSIEEIIPFVKDSIALGKDVRITVTGNSMYPLFRSNQDTVTLEAFEQIRKYDVVLYKRPNGQYVLHRVLKVCGDCLTIAGDNEIKKEYPVQINDCIARMKSFESRGRIYTTDAGWYKSYCRLWAFIFPLRHVAVAGIKAVAVLRKKLKRGKGGDSHE